jgi:limonene-1,2-epoxide hydrolase
MRKAFAEYLTDDCVWGNSGFPTCEGKDSCLAFLDGFAQAVPMGSLEIETLNLAVAGDTVLTERVDRFKAPDGTVFASLEIGGLLRVRGDQICEWRDYFDPRPLLPPG